MSGHNPHGRLGQPNPPWNHLQVPSYIPRQPQLAHMSNERPMVRSPLTWHTPHTEAALYNYMAATHKTPLDINPILPGFGRNTAPFGSVDLSISSAVRNNAQLSPRNITPPVVTAGTIVGSASQTPPPQHLEFNLNKSLASNITQSSSIGVIQSTASIKEKLQTPPLVAQNTSNGDVLHSTPPPPPSVQAPTPPVQQTMLYVRDAQQINNDIVALTREPIGLPTVAEPIQLVKEVLYNTLKNVNDQISPKPQKTAEKLSPLSMVINATVTANSSTVPSQPCPISPKVILPSSSHVSNVAVSPLIESHETPSVNVAFNTTPLTTSASNDNNFPKDNQASTSNDDSLDSTSGKRRRKRKPSKTTRMSSSDNDDSFRGTNNKRICLLDDESSTKSIGSNSTSSSSGGVLDTNQLVVPVSGSVASATVNVPSAATANIDDDAVGNGKREEKQIGSTLPINVVVTEPEVIAPISLSVSDLTNVTESTEKIVTNNSAELTTKTDTIDDVTEPIILNQTSVIKEPQEINTQTSTTVSAAVEPRISTDESILIKTVPEKRKSDNDDCETIDKIAAMIASTSSDYEQDGELSSCLSGPVETTSNVNTEQTTPDETDSLKDILSCSQEKVDQKDNSYEEVENKLEEMFAGIEDDRPHSMTHDSECKMVKTEKDPEHIIRPIESENDEKDTKSPIPQTSNFKVDTLSMETEKKISIAPLTTAVTTIGKMEKSTPKARKRYPKKAVNNTKNKKLKNSSKVKEKTNEKKGAKSKDDVAIDALKYKGPYVQVKCDGSTVVVNTPITEEVAENKAKIKKSFSIQKSNDRSKIRGLHVSTLSVKYDADTTDKSWICVFCKMGPHKFGLGDLFGPYIVTTTCEEYLLSQVDPKDDEFKSKRTRVDMIQKRGLPVTAAQSSGLIMNVGGNSKKKRKISEVNVGNTIASPSPSSSSSSFLATNSFDIYYGMTKASDDSYEVWMHGDCAIWAPGVHIIGTRIVGLEAAVWSSTRYQCTLCQRYGGAMLSCLKRGCREASHIPCARSANWLLNENDFKSLCDKHRSDATITIVTENCSDASRNTIVVSSGS